MVTVQGDKVDYRKEQSNLKFKINKLIYHIILDQKTSAREKPKAKKKNTKEEHAYFSVCLFQS